MKLLTVCSSLILLCGAASAEWIATSPTCSHGPYVYTASCGSGGVSSYGSFAAAAIAWVDGAPGPAAAAGGYSSTHVWAYSYATNADPELPLSCEAQASVDYTGYAEGGGPGQGTCSPWYLWAASDTDLEFY